MMSLFPAPVLLLPFLTDDNIRRLFCIELSPDKIRKTLARPLKRNFQLRRDL